MPPPQRDHYSVLGVLRDASPEDIRQAHLEVARRLHPDKNVAAGDTELFLDAQRAYEVLSNPERRAQYDATLPPEHETHPALRHQITLSRPHLYEIAEPQVIHALLQIAPRHRAQSLSASPINVCLLLDRSTSMKGEKLDTAKASAIQLIRTLRPEDIFSLVAFSDKPEVIIPAGDRGDRRQLENRIHMLQPSGSTEILRGLEAAMAEVRRSLSAEMVHHLILLTDGHTYGDEEGCLELAGEAARQGIGMTALGIGLDWNDGFLDALASRTGGTSDYISDPADIRRLLIDKFTMLTRVYVDDILLEQDERQGIQVREAFRLQPEGGPIAMHKPLHLGPILQDVDLRVIFEFVVEPSALASGPIPLLDGVLRIAATNRTDRVPPLRLQLALDVQPMQKPVQPPDQLLRALSAWTLYRIQERAGGAADSGDFEGAARSLEHVASRLRSGGQSTLASTSLLEAQELTQERRWKGSGRKDLKYGTRALLLAEGQDELR